MENADNSKITLGVSSCLLGNKVRFDGGHQHDRFITDILGPFVRFVPVCPEVECGMSIPREALRLVGDPENPRLVTGHTGRDMTEQMQSWAKKRLDELEKEGLCGFIFKSNSPSSGMERVRVYPEKGGTPSRKGVGLFARELMDRFPGLPVEEDGRLNAADLRENFIERIFVVKRWQEITASGKKRGALVEFHARHKLLILSHSRAHLERMGKMVAAAKEYSPKELFDRYYAELMDALKRRTSPGRHVDVMQHVLGYFREQLNNDERHELLETFENYRHGYLPLIVPITLLNHHVRKYDQPYLAKQYYLHPHPTELALRNHV